MIRLWIACLILDTEISCPDFFSVTLFRILLSIVFVGVLALEAGARPKDHLDLSDEYKLEVETLNDEAVRALKKKNYELAFEKFEAALRLDKKNMTVRKNLSTAHNNLGLYLAGAKKDPHEGLKELHKAIYFDAENKATRKNADSIIRQLDLDPGRFEDRVELGDKARDENDLEGAAIEYAQALKIQDDKAVRKKLGKAMKLLEKAREKDRF